MIDVENYICNLIALLKERFGERLIYVGLQGSYLRGEATPDSDIDVMVVIDKLNVFDLDGYQTIIRSMEHNEKACGFICGKDDLAHWNPLEICHLINSTKDYFGVLSDLVPAYTVCDIRNFVKTSVNNLYHEICHGYIYAQRNISELISAYKCVFFILQNLYYLKHQKFVQTKDELLRLLNGQDYVVLKCLIDFNNGEQLAFSESFQLLFTWCQETLKAV